MVPGRFSLILTWPAWLLLLTLGGCASAPEFIPSGDVERSASVPESLMLCNEYRMPAPSERPIALRPYVDCMDRVAARSERQGRAFEEFRRELQLRYDTLSEAEWTPRLGSELETAVHASLRALWSLRSGTRPVRFTNIERELVLRHFPRSAELLGTEQWPTSRQIALDPKLETLKAAMSALWDDEESGPVQGSDLARSRELCGQLLKLQGSVTYLDALWNDVEDLSRMAAQMPESAELLPRIESKYRRKLVEAGAELGRVRPGVQSAKQGGAFSPARCRGA